MQHAKRAILQCSSHKQAIPVTRHRQAAPRGRGFNSRSSTSQQLPGRSCRADAAKTEPTATWTSSSSDHENSDQSRFSEFEEYAACLKQATAQHSQQGAAYNWLDHWYPVGFIKDFDSAAPHRFVLLGIPLVIWHDPTSSSSTTTSSSSDSSDGWRVFADACPHRLVPLSEGRVTPSGRLECPYHGWQFNAAGGCEVIPQEGNLHSPHACATAFPCVVRHGLLFVKLQLLPKMPVGTTSTTIPANLNGSSSSSSSVVQPLDPLDDVPTVPELDQDGWISQDTWRDVPYDWASLMENVLDASHVPFTHHKSISNRQIISDYSNMRLTQQVSKAGFSGIWPSGPRGGALGAQATNFVAPCLMTHKIVSESRGFESMVVVYAVPVGPGKCRLLNRNTFRFTKGGLGAQVARAVMKVAPGWAVHMGTQVPLEDDQIFLHIGELQYVAARQQGKSATQAYYLPSKADTYITAFRRWIAGCGGGGPFGDVTQPNYLEQIGARQTREELLDRYSQHTSKCAQCQAALRKIRAFRRALSWVSGASASLGLFTAAVAASSSVTAPAAAVASTQGGGVLGHVQQLFLALLRAVAGVGSADGAAAGAAVAAVGTAADTAGPLGRLAVWLGVAGFTWLLHQQLGQVEGKLLHGDYPPPRNLDRS